MHKMLVDEAQRRASYWFGAEADERIVMTLWDAVARQQQCRAQTSQSHRNEQIVMLPQQLLRFQLEKRGVSESRPTARVGRTA